MLEEEENVQIVNTNYAHLEGHSQKEFPNENGWKVKIFYVGVKEWNTLKNALQTQPSSEKDCKAKINATVCPDGSTDLNNFVLEHNHALNLRKA